MEIPLGLRRPIQKLVVDPVNKRKELERLYDRYAEATFGYFVRRCGDGAQAADLNQELYIRLSSSLDTYEGRCSWRTWVFAIARNVLFDSRNQRWNKLAQRTVTLEVEPFETALMLPVDADEQAGRTLLQSRLASCMRRLDDVARSVVIGHYFEGATLRELTEGLRLSNASGSRAVMIAALRKLRKCLENTATT